jgi:hypothetical protein
VLPTNGRAQDDELTDSRPGRAFGPHGYVAASLPRGAVRARPGRPHDAWRRRRHRPAPVRRTPSLRAVHPQRGDGPFPPAACLHPDRQRPAPSYPLRRPRHRVRHRRFQRLVAPRGAAAAHRRGLANEPRSAPRTVYVPTPGRNERRRALAGPALPCTHHHERVRWLQWRLHRTICP